MQIRPANPDDVDAVLPLVEQIIALHAAWDSARFAPLPDVRERYRHWLTGRCGDGSSVFLVAQRESRIVAMLVATTEESIPIYALPRFGFIHDLIVEPEYRNEGIARAMTLLALERFKAMGITQVRLETAARNDVARALFTSCGFRNTTQEMLCEL